MLAILHALKQWIPYPMERQFKVKMDHDSLKFRTNIIFRRATKIGYKNVGLWIWYHLQKRKTNVVADSLSRKDEDVEALLCAISIIQRDWITEARDDWKNNEEVWHSCKSCSKIPIHLIHLVGKLIHYGTKITYIFVRIPKSNKIFFWNCAPLP